LKDTDENSRIRIQDPDPDPLVRGMNPRIRIHPKMSWIHNTARKSQYPPVLNNFEIGETPALEVGLLEIQEFLCFVELSLTVSN
jgi:hypothetical protein